MSASRDRAVAARAKLDAAIGLLREVRGEVSVYATPGVKHQALTSADAALVAAGKTLAHLDNLIKRLL